jgi:hypothetical protein
MHKNGNPPHNHAFFLRRGPHSLYTSASPPTADRYLSASKFPQHVSHSPSFSPRSSLPLTLREEPLLASSPLLLRIGPFPLAPLTSLPAQSSCVLLPCPHVPFRHSLPPVIPSPVSSFALAAHSLHTPLHRSHTGTMFMRVGLRHVSNLATCLLQAMAECSCHGALWSWALWSRRPLITAPSGHATACCTALRASSGGPAHRSGAPTRVVMLCPRDPVLVTLSS